MANEFKVKNGLIVIGDLTTSGTITINGALAATQSWVTSQAYLTSASLSGYATQSYVTSALAALVDAAPAALDTLNELAAALGDDANFSTTITNSIASKQAQLNGTGLVRMSGTSVSYDNTTYLTSYTETDTLATVTNRGNSTTGEITVNGTTTIQNGGYLKFIAGSVGTTGFTVFNAAQNGYLSNRITTSDHARGWGWELTDNLPTTASPGVFFRIGYNGTASYLTSGNFGIGTTSPAEQLHIYGGASGYGTNLRIDSTSEYGGLSIFESGNLRGTVAYGNNGNILSGAASNSLSIRSENALHLAGSGDNLTMTITGGNVGVGTTSPAQKLDVIGKGVFGSLTSSRGGYSNGLSLQNNTGEATSLFLWQSGVASAHIGSPANSTSLHIVNSYNTGLITDPNSIVLTNTGNVGIGTTTPNQRLSVEGGSIQLNANNAAANYYLNLNKKSGQDGGIVFTRDNAADWQLTNGAGNGDLIFYSYGTSTEAITFKRGTGNVGIGTTSPSDKLSVNGNIGVEYAGYFGFYRYPGAGHTFSTDGITSAMFGIAGGVFSGRSDAGLTVSGYDQLRFYTENSERIRINRAGKVSIGTSDTNSDKSDFTVYTGSGASLALVDDQVRMGGTDVNWGVALRSTGYLETYGQALYLQSLAGNHPVVVRPNNTSSVEFYQDYTLFNGLNLSISRINSAHAANYFRGDTSHLVIGTGGTLYLNYGGNTTNITGNTTNSGWLGVTGIVSANARKLSLGILDLNSGITPAQYKIKTNIPWNYGGSDFTVNIKGFRYGVGQMVSLSIGWHYYNNEFYNRNAISNGAWAPTISLAKSSDGYVIIYIPGPDYWPKLYVESVYSSNSTDSYTSGWSWTDADLSDCTLIQTVPYNALATNISGNAATATSATTAGALSSMNISQFTNNSGYITGYTETDTLASVTGRGATTSTAVTFNGGVNLAADTGIRKAGDNWIIGYSASLPGIAIGSGTATDKVSISAGGTQRVWFDTNGRVGIGTSTPAEELHVSGRAIFDGASGNSSTDAVVYITKSNNNDWGLYVNAAALDYGMYARVSSSANYALAIHNGTTWTTRITGDGRIYLTEKDTIASYDTWLRLNESGHYGSGVYTPGVMRADGGFQVSGNTVIHSGTIGSQSVSYANSAGYAGYVNNQSGQLLRYDNRTISPSETNAGYLQFGFTSWDNNGGSPYADYLHMRSYTDGSGGNDNLVMFLKSGIGMRIYQQTFGSASAYSSYADVWHSGNLTNLNQLTNGPGYITGYSETDTLNSVTGRGNTTGNNIITSANVYASIFYDYSDNGYYLDPNGNSVLTTATFNVNASSTLILTSAGTNASQIKAGAGDELYIGGNNSWQMRFSGANVLMDNGGYLQNNESLRAPIFYDSNDTNYYGDFAGTSRFNNLYIEGAVASLYNASGYASAAIEVRERNFGGAQDDTWSTAPRIGFHWAGRVAAQIALASNGRIHILNDPGTANEGFQAGIIYSSGYGDSTQWNTAYGWGNHASASYATTSYVTTQINNLINGAPGVLDTLDELAAALGDDANFATTVTNSIAGKVSKSGDTMTGNLTTTGLTVGNGVATGRQPYGPLANANIVLNSSAADSSGVCGIEFLSGNNYPSDGASIYFQNNAGGGSERAKLTLRVDNDLEDFIELRAGKVVINANTYSGGGQNPAVIFQHNDSQIVSITSGGQIDASGGNSSQWNTAYGWGNHASAGYALNSSLANYLPLSGGVIGGGVTINGNLTVNGTITENSSIKLKENVETSEGNLEKVVNLRPVTYNKIGSQTTELGLIAEEVAEVYPEFVQYDENGEPVGVNYSRLTAALIGAVKELTNQVQELNKKING